MKIKKVLEKMGVRGRVRNRSSKVLWIVETSTNGDKGPALAHKLFPGWLSKTEAIHLTREGEIGNAVVVDRRRGRTYLRTFPGQINFSEMMEL